MCSLSETCVLRGFKCRLFVEKTLLDLQLGSVKPQRGENPREVVFQACSGPGWSGCDNALLMLAPRWLVESCGTDKGGLRLNVTQNP